LTERWSQATALLSIWFPDAFLGHSYQSFIKALARWTPSLIEAIRQHFRRKILLLDLAADTLAGNHVIAIDGTKVDVPWSDHNHRKLGEGTVSLDGRLRRRARRARRRSAKRARPSEVRPQLLMTLGWDVRSGLPFSWRIGATTESERDHARQMMGDFPKNSLLVMDAGFTGYDFWEEILNAGHRFVVRIGSNVKLLKKLGWKVKTSGDFVYLWPAAQQRERRAPLVLRLISFQTAKSRIWVGTSVRSSAELSDRHVAAVYRARWGIEGWFRSLKQTFGRRKMHSKTASHAICELHWSIVGLAIVQLHGVEALLKSDQDPHQLSEAQAIRAVCATLLHGDVTVKTKHTLQRRLERAVLDDYKRTAPKSARHPHPRKNSTGPGAPTVVLATPAEKRAARQLQAAKRAA
jgi:hypothetical protein